MEDKSKSDYDSGWKEVIEKYFEDFLLFFFPQVHSDIDCTKGVEFLDKEFNKIVKESGEKKRYVDKLVKVWLKTGVEKWLLIHIEVQGTKEEGFEKRLYVYNYRIFDRYDKEVVTLVILTDEDKVYRPDVYEVKRWGFEHRFNFPVIKLVDYRDKIDIEGAKNPFEIITYAHLKNQETKGNYEERLFLKVTLVKALYGKGYGKDDILNLYRFIDWIVGLPEELSIRFHEEIIKYEEERKMQYVTTAERIGIQKGVQLGEEKGIQKGIQEGMERGMERGMEVGEEKGLRSGLYEAIEDLLEIKFKEKDILLMERIRKIEDIERLRTIKESVKKSESFNDVEVLIS